MTHRPVIAAILVLILGRTRGLRAADPPSPIRGPLHRVLDLDLGESRQVELRGGTKARVKLVAIDEIRDTIRDAVRACR